MRRPRAVQPDNLHALRRAAATAELITSRPRSMWALRAYMSELDRNGGYAQEHSVNVADLVALIHHELGTPEQHINRRYQAALLHDIGKLGVPMRILTKPGPLSAEEYDSIKTHSGLGAEVVAAIDHLQDLALEIRHHHERVDGAGYPDRLVGDEIPLAARVLAVADAFDAMTSERVYRQALSREQGLEELIRSSGSQLDPSIVDAFVTALKRAA